MSNKGAGTSFLSVAMGLVGLSSCGDVLGDSSDLSDGGSIGIVAMS